MSAAAVQIWIRQKGTRRQAFYRYDSACPWKDMLVKHADEALRTGFMKLGSTRVAVVPRETPEPAEHPAAADFRAHAAFLNGQIDAINGTGATP